MREGRVHRSSAAFVTTAPRGRVAGRPRAGALPETRCCDPRNPRGGLFSEPEPQTSTSALGFRHSPPRKQCSRHCVVSTSGQEKNFQKK